MTNKLMSELNNMILTMKTVGKEYRNLVSNDSLPQAIDLLTSCQSAAISIGNRIEENEGEGTNTVTLLEDYCELLYNISQKSLETADDVLLNIDEYVKHLDDTIENIEKSLLNEISVRTEVVFLPYKAAMWDSLESVWKAADEDPSVDAYVIPIPYYDKNPDGTFGLMHYEGDEYPSDVPITKWDEYNIAFRLPDMIFIHNPYDSCNKVTSVPLDYYASVLRKYTDMLVYIPYFVCLNDIISEHFIVLPGTIYADKVILQSSTVKKSYIQEYSKQLNLMGMSLKEDDLNSKFLALGSPKIDKVISTHRDNITIPDGWNVILNNENKSIDRKIILYNTTLQALMINPEKYIDKLDRVLKQMRDNKNIILLWRPHPLMMETIQSLYPKLHQKFVDIVKLYKCEKWGIYDDTSDLNRAIALSDAYYGDLSSIVELYKCTGKPILIQTLK